MTDQPWRSNGRRDNGLLAEHYVAVGDLDPRIADALLRALRDEGIAAYATPTPAPRGGYLEVRLPGGALTDRIFVDQTASVRALELVRAESTAGATTAPLDEAWSAPESADALVAGTTRPGEADDAAELDLEESWAQVLAAWDAPAPPANARPWPRSEDVERPRRRRTDRPADADAAPVQPAGPQQATAASAARPDPIDLDDHYRPPEAPHVPRLAGATVACLVAIALGIAVLVTGVDGGALGWLGVLAVVSGAAGLVWRVKDEPPSDDDDGAVV